MVENKTRREHIIQRKVQAHLFFANAKKPTQKK
jgi:hypothetical protein